MARAFDPFTRPELLSQTSRYREIDLLDKVFAGTQYEGRPNWWTGKHHSGDEERPLRERKPCIIYRLPKAAVQQVVRFLFGEKRFPRISLETAEGEDGGYPAISEEDAEVVDDWMAALVEHGNLQPNVRAIATKAIACKTAVVVLEVDRGEFRVTLPRPQDCHAKFEDDNPAHPVQRLLWSYEFDKEVADENGNPTTKRHLFRREWDDRNVHLYDDVELKHGQPVEWPAPRVEAHGLSFCPVIWIRNESEYSQGLDGISLYESLEDEFEALDMALSRRHQGIIYLGAPQLVETGVAPDDGPDASGHKAGPAGFSGAGAKHQTLPKARRVAPDSVWTYEGEKVNVALIETSGKAFEVGTQHVNDIRSRILETMGVVLTSMADTVSRVTVGADMSARFLALAHAPLIALVQEYRHTWWPHGLRKIISMMMRMTVELTAKGQRIMIPGSEKAADVLSRFVVEGEWVTPRMVPHWGKFFDPSSTEIKTTVESVVQARDGRIISGKTAVEVGAHDFGVDSVEAEIEEIESDKETAMAEQQALMAQNPDPNGDDDGSVRPPDRRSPGPTGTEGSGKAGNQAPAGRKEGQRKGKRRPRPAR